MRQNKIPNNTLGRLALAGMLSLAFPVQAADEERPNIIMILVDDLGWSDLGCQGSTYYKTANIDRLAAEGMRFTDAYASPTCSPTRAALLTGKSPARLHLTNPLGEKSVPPQSPRERGRDYPWNKYIDPVQVSELTLEEETVAERLKNAGYTTAIFGKWHLGGKGFEPEKQGFDVNVGAGHYAHPRSYFAPYRMEDVIQDGPEGEYLTDRLADEAIRFIETSRTNPFFIYLSHYAPHTPIEGKADKVAEYQKNPDPSGRHFNAEYAAMIDSLDENVGRLMQALQKTGLDRNTLVVFVSDNGGVIETFGGNEKITSNLPLRSGKGTLWEGGVRVPMIARWPGVVPAGSVCSVPVVVMDFFPTFSEIGGVPIKTGVDTALDGESLLPLLKDPSARLQRDSLCWLYPHNNRFTDWCSSIRKGNMKLIRFYSGPVQLFDLKTDLGETKDLAEQFPEQVTELMAEMDGWLSRVGAWEMVPNPNFDPRAYSPGLYDTFDPKKDGAELVAEWNFDDSRSGWHPASKCKLEVKHGRLMVDCLGYGASMETDVELKQAGTYVLQMKVREQDIKKGACRLFWGEKDQKNNPRNRMQFALPHDDKEHVVAALFRVSSPVRSLRFDPATSAGKFEFDWIRIYKTDLP